MMSKTSQILGMGNDILEIDRFRAALRKHGERMLHRLFTPEERDYCLSYRDPVPHLAGRFCAKEAIAKALGTGIGKSLAWTDIAILHSPSGKPYVHLTKQPPNTEVLISISHCKLYATAVALWTLPNMPAPSSEKSL